MNYTYFARVLAIATLYLGMSEDLYSDPDAAVQGLEDLVTAMQDMTPEEVAHLDEALQQVALEYTGEAQESIKAITRDFGLIEDPEDE